MSEKTRRSVVASGATLVASSVFASSGTASTAISTNAEPVDEVPGWSSYRGNAANAAYIHTDEFSKPDEVAWTSDATGDIAVSKGQVYLRTENDLRAINAEDGSLVWQHQRFDWKGEDFNPTGTPAVRDGIVYVAGDQLTAVDANDGSLVWEAALDGSSEITSPTVAYGSVYVVVDSSLYAFDASDGALEWDLDAVEIEIRDPDGGINETVTREFSIQQTPIAVADERIYALVEETDFEAVAVLDAHSGETHWTDLDRSTSHSGPIVVGDDSFYSWYSSPDLVFDSAESIRSYEGVYEGITPSSTGEVTITGGHYYLAGEDWSNRPGWLKPYRNLLIAGETGLVYLVGRPYETEDAIVGFDIYDGSMKWEITAGSFPEIGISSQFIAGEDRLYMQVDGRLVALQPAHVDGGTGDDTDDTDDGGNSDDGDGTDNGDDNTGDDTDGGGDTDSSENGSTGNDTDDTGEAGEPDGTDDTDDGSTDGGEDSSETTGTESDDTSDDSDDEDTTDSQEDDPVEDTADEVVETGEDPAGSSDDTLDDTESSDSVDEDNGDLGSRSNGSDASDQEDQADRNGGADEPDEGDTGANEGDDGLPGFTAGAGLISSALGVEWFRRRASTVDSEEVSN